MSNLPIIVSRGIVWEPCSPGDAEWYFHYGETGVFPYAGYNVMHPQHCVLPVRPVMVPSDPDRPVLPAPPRDVDPSDDI